MRAGDCIEKEVATVQNCCVLCLGDGRRVSESLIYFYFDCPRYAIPRLRMAAKGFCEMRTAAFCFHQAIFKSSLPMKDLKDFTREIWRIRIALLGGSAQFFDVMFLCCCTPVTTCTACWIYAARPLYDLFSPSRVQCQNKPARPEMMCRQARKTSK